MNTPTFDVNKLRVASPCPVGWDTMSGNDRKRHCDLCELNVYNVAELSPTEVEQLVGTSGGRICMRLYRKADGTVITRDCPVGFRVVQRRVGRFVAAVFAAMLGFVSISYGQKEGKKSVDASKVTVERTISHSLQSEITGTITDANGAVIAGAKVKISQNGVVRNLVETNVDGQYFVTNVSAFDNYELEIRSSYFKTILIKNLKISSNERATLNVVMEVDGDAEFVGIIVTDEPALIETSSPTLKSTLTKRQIDLLPIRP